MFPAPEPVLLTTMLRVVPEVIGTIIWFVSISAAYELVKEVPTAFKLLMTTLAV